METRERRVERQLAYLNKLYKMAVCNISNFAISHLCNISSKLEFSDNPRELMLLDDTIYNYRCALRIMAKKHKSEECKELYRKMTYVHSELSEVLKAEYNLNSCFDEQLDKLKL